jgi:hypothetical protein
MSSKDAPNFAAWNLDTLAQFATDAYHKLRLQEDTIEQLRRDLKDAMAVNRKLLTERDTDDWK